MRVQLILKRKIRSMIPQRLQDINLAMVLSGLRPPKRRKILCALASASFIFVGAQAEARVKRVLDDTLSDMPGEPPGDMSGGPLQNRLEDRLDDRIGDAGRSIAKNARPIQLLPKFAKAPVTIVVSIDQQALSVYEGDTRVGGSMVSTGVPAHPTPLGVFSIIQKQQFHRSNIYSNAPMPFMQRLTWSGVALHQGHVTGAVASHGCIRLPASFAQALYRYTREGARVIIAREEVYPAAVYGLAPFAQETPSRANAVMAMLTDGAANDTVAAAKEGGAQANAPSADSAALERDLEIGIPAAAPPESSLAPGQAASTREPATKKTSSKNPNNAAPITVLVNRRTGKIYVRRALTPIFELPVAIDQPERPLGLHLFVARKAEAPKNGTLAQALAPEGETLAWSAFSLATPVAIERPVRRQTKDGDADMANNTAMRLTGASRLGSSDTSASASLQRIHLAPGALARIAALLTPGAALILSDEGARGREDWNGTNFIALSE